MTIAKIIELAKRTDRIRDGFVLCENCDTPASKTYSTTLSWLACGGCATGESAEVDPADFITVDPKRGRK